MQMKSREQDHLQTDFKPKENKAPCNVVEKSDEKSDKSEIK